MREHRTSIAMVFSVLSDIGVERHVRLDSRHLRTPTQRERRSFTLSVQSNARTRLPSNVSVVFQGQISSSSDAIS